MRKSATPTAPVVPVEVTPAEAVALLADFGYVLAPPAPEVTPEAGWFDTVTETGHRVTPKGRVLGTTARTREDGKALIANAKAYAKAHPRASKLTALAHGNPEIYPERCTRVMAAELGLPTTF